MLYNMSYAIQPGARRRAELLACVVLELLLGLARPVRARSRARGAAQALWSSSGEKVGTGEKVETGEKVGTGEGVETGEKVGTGVCHSLAGQKSIPF